MKCGLSISTPTNLKLRWRKARSPAKAVRCRPSRSRPILHACDTLKLFRIFRFGPFVIADHRASACFRCAQWGSDEADLALRSAFRPDRDCCWLQVASGSLAQDVRYNFDKDTDFSKLKT